MHGTFSYDLAKIHQAELVAEAKKHRTAALAKPHGEHDHVEHVELGSVLHRLNTALTAALAAIGLGPRAASAASRGHAA